MSGVSNGDLAPADAQRHPWLAKGIGEGRQIRQWRVLHPSIVPVNREGLLRKAMRCVIPQPLLSQILLSAQSCTLPVSIYHAKAPIQT